MTMAKQAAVRNPPELPVFVTQTVPIVKVDPRKRGIGVGIGVGCALMFPVNSLLVIDLLIGRKVLLRLALYQHSLVASDGFTALGL